MFPDQKTEQAAKHAIDGGIALGAITWPVWVQFLNTAGYVITFLGGLILLCLRIAIAWHEWRTRNDKASK